MISLLGNFLGPLLLFGVSFAYPAYLTFNFLLSYVAPSSSSSSRSPPPAATASPADCVQHLFYWVLYAWMCILDSLLLSRVAAFIPLYYELQAALFYWLASPEFKGAGWMWLVVVRPYYKEMDRRLKELYDQYCPPQVKTYLSYPSRTVESTTTNDAFKRERISSAHMD